MVWVPVPLVALAVVPVPLVVLVALAVVPVLLVVPFLSPCMSHSLHQPYTTRTAGGQLPHQRLAECIQVTSLCSGLREQRLDLVLGEREASWHRCCWRRGGAFWVQKRVVEELRHADPRGWAAVQAPRDDVGQLGVADGRHGDGVVGVDDGVHLLDKGEVGKGGVAVHHLVQDAAEAPYVRRAFDLCHLRNRHTLIVHSNHLLTSTATKVLVKNTVCVPSSAGNPECCLPPPGWLLGSCS